MSNKEIFQRQSCREIHRKIEIRRKKQDGTYEDWVDINDITDTIYDLISTVPVINYSLPEDTYNYGIVLAGNCKLALNSKGGEFADESNSSSIFYDGFIRHESMVRVKFGYVDNFSSPVTVDFEQVFEGFIDGVSKSTTVDKNNLVQYWQCIDTLTFLLKKYNISEIEDPSPIVSTSLNDIIYEIMNREIFTDFFTVDVSNISSAYNIGLMDMSVYEGQTSVFSVLQNISIANSVFFVRDGIFYYSKYEANGTLLDTFEEDKIVNFYDYDDGLSRVYDRIYWKDQSSSIQYISPTITTNAGKTFEVDACVNDIERQSLLNSIGGRLRVKRKRFSLKIPFYPSIFLLDRVKVENSRIYPSDAFIWGVSRWGEAVWRRPIGAASTNTLTDWLCRKIKHNGKSMTTELIFEEVI